MDTTENEDRAEAIFYRAVTAPAAEARDALLAEACGHDDALRTRVCELLAAHVEAERRLKLPHTASSATEVAGAQVGPYKLLEQLGEGGFGAVFMSEQQTPVRRLVALKVIKLGMDTRQVIARFEAERQALAMMEHPNIARVLDAGATEAGRPYFVMELVRGVPLTQFCDSNKPSIRQRLELVVQVCSAVQHAHQKGIIHRDLKPSNVLVTTQDDRPVPKVIDFGIAKATQTPLTERTPFTELRQFMGTPQYTSPEQAQMSELDVDTRADIYSLGVILYELLTGTTPLDPEELNHATFADVQRLIRETEPQRPSVRLSTLGNRLDAIASQRRTDPRQLPRAVRGELDWIVMKCLERDRGRRYESAAALSADVQRFLNGDVILARPASTVYRLKKFVRRHRVAVGLAASVALAVLVSVAALGWVVRDRSARAARLAAAVESPLQESAAARRRALANADNPFIWEAELTAAWECLRRAEELGGQSPAALDGDLRHRLAMERAAVEADRRDRDFVARFDELMTGHLPWDARRSGMASPDVTTALAKSFAATYAVEAVVTPAEHVMAVIHSRPAPVRDHLLAALDVWLGQSPTEATELRRWRLVVLAAADDSPWRARMRTALAAQDWKGLERQVMSGVPGHQPAVLLQLYMSRVPSFEAKDQLLELIRRADPHEFWAPSRFARASAYDRLAWYSATTDAPQLRNETFAVQMAERAVALAPTDADFWNTLGVSRYRAGAWAGAVEALDTAVRLSQGGDGLDWIFLAMVHQRLGHADEARGWYVRATQWAREHPSGDRDIERFEAEAAQILGGGNATDGPTK